MKKILTLAAIGIFTLSMTQAAHTVVWGWTEGSIPISTNNVAGTPDFDPFSPSTNVYMMGQTASSGFTIGALHDQVVGKKSGKAFGMASDSNKVYYLDISDEDTFTSIAVVSATDTSDSSYFETAIGGQDWVKM